MDENQLVVIGIVNKDNKILMIKRAKIENDLIWAFPGGKVDSNETPEEACVREIFEETNVNVDIEELLGTRVHPNTNRTIKYYLCKYKSGLISIKFPEEVKDISFKKPQEVFECITTDLYEPIKIYLKKINTQ